MKNKEALGPVAQQWWDELFRDYDHEKEFMCEECLDLTNKVHEIHPHKKDDDFNEENAAKRKAVSWCANARCLESCSRSPPSHLPSCPPPYHICSGHFSPRPASSGLCGSSFTPQPFFSASGPVRGDAYLVEDMEYKEPHRNNLQMAKVGLP